MSGQQLLGVIVVGQMTEKVYKRKGQKLNLWGTGYCFTQTERQFARTDMVEEAIYLAITE